MAATLSELEDRVNRLNQRVALLATTEQVNDLQVLVAGWKQTSDDNETLLQSKVDAIEARLNDIESRVLILETP